MSDYYNPKLRVKFLRSSTINHMNKEPGNLMVDMDTGRVFIDILASNNQPKRITISGFEFENYYNKAECDNKFVAEADLQRLIDQLDGEANGGMYPSSSTPSTIIRRLTTDEYTYSFNRYNDQTAQYFAVKLTRQGEATMPTWGTSGDITRSAVLNTTATITYPSVLSLYIDTDNFIGAFFDDNNAYVHNDIFLLDTSTTGNLTTVTAKIVFSGNVSLAATKNPVIRFERYSGTDIDTSLFSMKFAISYDQTEPNH